MNRSSCSLYCVVSFLMFACFSHHTSAEEFDSRQLLREAGIQGGIVVQLGCSDLQQCLDLPANGHFAVQVLDRDAEQVAIARETIESKGLIGSVSTRRINGKKLPYADNLVNLMVVE